MKNRYILGFLMLVVVTSSMMAQDHTNMKVDTTTWVWQDPAKKPLPERNLHEKRQALADTLAASAATISIGATVVTIGPAGGQLNVRQKPVVGGPTPALIGTIPVGTTATVLSGPTATDSGTQWWQVKFSVCTGSAALLALNCTGYIGGDQLTLTAGGPPTQPGSPIISVSCTPRFPPVSLATFVPSGAKGVSFTLANSGPGVLVITSAKTALPFAVTAVDAFPITLQVGQSETFTATFVPTIKGTFVANVNIFASSSPTVPAMQFAVTGVSQ